MIAVMMVALMLRLAVQIYYFDELKTDPDSYVALADGIGQHYDLQLPGSAQPTAFRPPLYSVLIAVAQLIWGNAWSVLTVNLIFGFAIVPAAWYLAHAAGLKGRWALLPPLLCAVDPLLLRYSSQPMTEVTAATLLTFAVGFHLGSVLISRYRGHTDVKLRVKSALCYGLAILTRPVALVTWALLCLTELSVCRPAGATGFARRWRGPAVIAIGGMFVVLPWIVRNAIHFEAFIPATTHGGYTLLLGNNAVFYEEVVLAEGQPNWQYESLMNWQAGLQTDMQNSGVDLSDERQVDRWMYRRALDEIEAQPAAFLKACVLRWKRFWSLSGTAGAESRWITAAVGVWYVACFTGLLFSLRPVVIRQPEVQMLWMAVVSFLLVHSFYWTNTRMRAPLTAVIATLAVLGVRAVVWNLAGIRIQQTPVGHESGSQS